MTTTAVDPVEAPPPEPAAPDERVRQSNTVAKLLGVPGAGAVIALVAVYVFFVIVAHDDGFVSWASTASILNAAAPLGIVAIGVSLLMIAGDFDLSVGSMMGFSGVMLMLFISPESIGGYNMNVWAAIVVVFAICMAVGALNGFLVVATKLPSFIITLGSLFILRGLAIALPRDATNTTVLSGIQSAPGAGVLKTLFADSVNIGDAHFSRTILWLIGLTIVASLVLSQKAGGNWIFGVGGDMNAARNIGVPVNRVRIMLFMGTAGLAVLAALAEVVRTNQADSLRHEMWEFRAIIAVVVGGTLLTGGYGTVVGAVIGAVIFGMVEQGILITGVDSDWFRVFLGGVLVAAVIFNNFIRNMATRR